MNVPCGNLDANVPIVHLEGVQGSLLRADVALAGERGHGDGVPELEQRQVVTQSSVHVELRGWRKQPMKLVLKRNQSSANQLRCVLSQKSDLCCSPEVYVEESSALDECPGREKRRGRTQDEELEKEKVRLDVTVRSEKSCCFYVATDSCL